MILLAAAALFAACDNLVFENPAWIIADLPPATPSEMPPFVVSKPSVEIIERANYFNYAGMVFKFMNNAEETADSITFTFMLFDHETGNNPFIGSNKFEIKKWDFVVPDENKEMIVSLDHFIYSAPTEPYIIDFFYISEIHYIDDSIWEDKYGKYRVRF
jgi:hypothetical protein